MSLLRLLTTLVASPTIQIDPATGQLYADGIPLGGVPLLPVQISSAQLKNMKALPITILPALPSGVMAQPLFATFQYKPVSVDYELGDAGNLFIGSAVQPTSLYTLAPLAADILDGSNPGNLIGKMPASNVLVAPQSQFENQALVLTHDGSSEITSGDGTVVVTLAYQTVVL